MSKVEYVKVTSVNYSSDSNPNYEVRILTPKGACANSWFNLEHRHQSVTIVKYTWEGAVRRAHRLAANLIGCEPNEQMIRIGLLNPPRAGVLAHDLDQISTDHPLVNDDILTITGYHEVRHLLN